MKTMNPKPAAWLIAGLAAMSSFVQAQTLDKILETNRITVSYREAAVPFSYRPGQGKAVGFAVDLTEAIVGEVRTRLNRPGLVVAYMPVSAQDRIPLLVNGSYDLECGSTTNNAARGKVVAFAVSHFYAGTRLLVKTGSKIRNYADLAGQTVATTAGSTNEKVLRKYSADHNLDVQFVLAKDYAESLALLENNRAAALALDDILLFGLRANARDPAALSVVGDTLQVEPYGCMLRKDDPEFKKLVDGSIARLMQSGEFGRLYHKWFESPIPPNGVVLNMPMSDRLKANLKALSDQPEP